MSLSQPIKRKRTLRNLFIVLVKRSLKWIKLFDFDFEFQRVHRIEEKRPDSEFSTDSLRSTKRTALFCWLPERKYDIDFLQEADNTNDNKSIWRTHWQGKLYFSLVSSNHSCGVMILVRDDLDFKLILVRSDDNGRYIIMAAEV